MDEQGYINPRFSRCVKPETEAPTLSDLRKASQLVDESVLKILAEEGRYLGAAHPQDNLQAYASGHGNLMSYALFEANMDGVKALAPLTHQQLKGLMVVTASLDHPQGTYFDQQVGKAALDIDPTQFEAKPTDLAAA